MIENLINTTLESFDFAYCVSVNILTYLIINIVMNRSGNKNVGTWVKRLILLVCIIAVGVTYYNAGSEIKVLVNSSILAPVFWSWIMKPICKKFKLDYKQLSLFE